MRARALRLLFALPLCALALGPALAAPRGVRASRYVPPRSDCRGKAAPPLGEIEVLVADRPAPDRAVIQATWSAGTVGEEPRLSLVLPEGAFLVEGNETVPLSTDTGTGTATWQVQFPLGQALDAVVRLSAATDAGPRSRETAVRLTE
jgi:hypothetical protein